MANVIDYVELAVDDLAQAKAFYEKALGWAFNEYGDDYAGIKDPGRPGQEFGGLNPHPATSRGDGVLALVRSDDVEGAVTSVVAAGGRIQPSCTSIPVDGGSCSPTRGATSSASTSRPSRRRHSPPGALILAALESSSVPAALAPGPRLGPWALSSAEDGCVRGQGSSSPRSR